MLAPPLHTPRDSWNHWRDTVPVGEEDFADLGQAVADWTPRDIEPVCVCGLKGTVACRLCGAEMERHCRRHNKGAPAHTRARTA
ncbi:hypothetical protein ACGRHY_02760 [Streptomyces sp. HK10]|uniref:hypothetical protein n=1 Tax=Streptomyces sp. HK10 TaxID=3373255 RepID=UPI0037499710